MYALIANNTLGHPHAICEAWRSLSGFFRSNHARERGDWFQQGWLKYQVDLVQGLENAISGMNRLLTGANTGKVIVNV